MEQNTSISKEKGCLNCGDLFERKKDKKGIIIDDKYCSDLCNQILKKPKEVSVENKKGETVKLSEIPTNFILNNITPYQKTAIIIKYIILQKGKYWKKLKYELYEDLADELNLSFERIRKIAKE